MARQTDDLQKSFRGLHRSAMLPRSESFCLCDLNHFYTAAQSGGGTGSFEFIHQATEPIQDTSKKCGLKPRFLALKLRFLPTS